MGTGIYTVEKKVSDVYRGQKGGGEMTKQHLSGFVYPMVPLIRMEKKSNKLPSTQKLSKSNGMEK